MGFVARLLAVAPVIALLAWSGFEAVRYAVAGSAASNASRELERLAKDPAGDTGPWWRDDLARAAAEVPHDPTVRELMAFAALRGNDPEGLQDAKRHLAAAIRERPGSGYAWANWALLKYRTGDTAAAFEKSLVNAVKLGPYEPEVQRDVVDVGLAVLDEVGPAARGAIEGALAAGMKRNVPEIMQIAGRRGRLDAACRHLDGAPRPTGSKWTNLCQSMEATS